MPIMAKMLPRDVTVLATHLQELDHRRATLLSDCPMPVPGIGFEADGVTLNDLPLDQASAAEQLKLQMPKLFPLANPL